MRQTMPIRKYPKCVCSITFEEMICALTQKSTSNFANSGDELPELSTADANVIKAWQEEKHLGSPTSILFFTKKQLQLWDERNVLFMEDYSTGNP